MRNCKDYCEFRARCTAEGEEGLDPDDCPTAWRIEEEEKQDDHHKRTGQNSD